MVSNDEVMRLLLCAEKELGDGFPKKALELLNQLEEIADRTFAIRRDLGLGKAMIRQAQTDPTAAKQLYRQAYELLVRRYIADGHRQEEWRKQLLELLAQAARHVDPALERLLQDPAGTHCLPDHEDFVKAFYFGGAMSGATYGDTAFGALEYIRKLRKPGRTLAKQERSILFAKVYSSFTPLLDSSSAQSRGGGYFLAVDDYGCVIDPGHHFVDNLYHYGRTVDDVDGVVVTHFHDDHYADLPPLLSLLYQRSKSSTENAHARPVDVFLDRQTADIFGAMTHSSHIRRSGTLDPDAPEPIRLGHSLLLHPLPTNHPVLDRQVGVGLAFSILPEHMSLIITGDTGWSENLAPLYERYRKDRPILVAHVSSVDPAEADVAMNRSDARFNSHHLCIRGLCRVIECAEPRAVILSEIGEELERVIRPLAQLVTRTYGIRCEVGFRGALWHLSDLWG